MTLLVGYVYYVFGTGIGLYSKKEARAAAATAAVSFLIESGKLLTGGQHSASPLAARTETSCL